MSTSTSTSISSHHPRLTSPAVMITAVATALVVSAAAAVGYTISHDDTASPSVSVTSTHHDGVSKAGTGMGDFTSNDGGHLTPLKGGHTMVLP